MKVWRAQEIERMRNKLRDRLSELDEEFGEVMTEGRKHAAAESREMARIAAGEADCCAVHERIAYQSPPVAPKDRGVDVFAERLRDFRDDACLTPTWRSNLNQIIDDLAKFEHVIANFLRELKT